MNSRFVVFMNSALLAVPVIADTIPSISRNPFQMPTVERAGVNTLAPGAELPMTPGTLELHAVMPGANALVSLNGMILGIGDTYAGYKLIAVGEDRARFLSDDDSVFELELRAVEAGERVTAERVAETDEQTGEQTAAATAEPNNNADTTLEENNEQAP